MRLRRNPGLGGAPCSQTVRRHGGPASRPRPVLPVPVGIAYRPNRFVAIPQLERRESPAVAGSDGSREPRSAEPGPSVALLRKCSGSASAGRGVWPEEPPSGADALWKRRIWLRVCRACRDPVRATDRDPRPRIFQETIFFLRKARTLGAWCRTPVSEGMAAFCGCAEGARPAGAGDAPGGRSEGPAPITAAECGGRNIPTWKEDVCPCESTPTRWRSTRIAT